MTEAKRTDPLSTPWRVFYTRARAEKTCEQRLTDARIEVFLPKHTVVRQWSDRRRSVSQPLFQNYIFARVDERERIAVLRSPGIVRCVAFGGRPATVTQDEIDRLRIMQTRPEWLEPVEALLPGVGNDVTIDSGPLRGLSGVVVEHRGDTHLVVQIPSVKQAVKVILPAAYAQTVSSSV
jgi:transcription antitermination factor NusG